MPTLDLTYKPKPNVKGELSDREIGIEISNVDPRTKNTLRNVIIASGAAVVGGIAGYLAWKAYNDNYKQTLEAYARQKGLPKDFVDIAKQMEDNAENRKKVDVVALTLELYGSKDELKEALKQKFKDGSLNELNNLDGDAFPQVKLSDQQIVEKDVGGNPLIPNPNLAYALNNGLPKEYLYLVKPLDADGVMQPEERGFNDVLIAYKKLLAIQTLLDYLEAKSKDGRITNDELQQANNFSYLVERIYSVISEEELAKDKINDTDYAAKLGLKLGFDRVKASNATAFAIAEYGVAVKELNLPLELEALRLLTEGTQTPKYGDKLVNFEPIVFRSVDGNDYVLVINKPRNTWMLARHLRNIRDSGFDVIQHPEMFEGINTKIIANAWSLFDAEYGISFMEKEKGRVIKPTDSDVWDLMMLQWKLYSQFAPQLGGGDKLYNRDFPWYDSDKLENLYPDPNVRRQALLFLWYLPNATFDMERQKKVTGVEGAKIGLEQAWEEYQKIVELYPDGKLRSHITKEDVNLRYYFYDWIIDRGHHGLSNTCLQFEGVDVTTLLNIVPKYPINFWQYLKDYNGLDQYLTQNWEYWDLVKAIVSYERWNATEIEGSYIERDVLKMFGFPYWGIGIKPNPPGTPVGEWAITLPQYIFDGLKEKFGSDSIFHAPGNIFGLYACKDGLIQDGMQEVFVMIPQTTDRIYLMKKP